MRILLAGLLGAIAMFVWSAVAHMATPLATIGISKMRNEQPVLDALRHNVGDSAGLYFYPWVDPKDPNMMQKEAERISHEPNGLLLYKPPRTDTGMGPMLIGEFAKQLAQALIAAFLLSLTALAAYGARVGFVVGLGVFASLGTDTSYWIWYGFPLDYTLAQIAIVLGEVLVAGLMIAAVLKPKPA